MTVGGATAGLEKTVGAVMSTELTTLQLTDTLRLADDMMNLAQVRHFPVLNGDKPIGILNQVDLLHASMASLVQHPKDPPREILGAIPIKDVMKPIITVTPESTIHEAARLMVERDCECLLVMDGSRLAGLVTRTDLLRHLATQ